MSARRTVGMMGFLCFSNLNFDIMQYPREALRADPMGLFVLFNRVFQIKQDIAIRTNYAHRASP